MQETIAHERPPGLRPNGTIGQPRDNFALLAFLFRTGNQDLSGRPDCHSQQQHDTTELLVRSSAEHRAPLSRLIHRYGR